MPAVPSVGLNSSVLSFAIAASTAALRSGVSRRSPSGAAKTRFRTRPARRRTPPSIRSVARCVSDPGICELVPQGAADCRDEHDQDPTMPTQLTTTRHGCARTCAHPAREAARWRGARAPPAVRGPVLGSRSRRASFALHPSWVRRVQLNATRVGGLGLWSVGSIPPFRQSGGPAAARSHAPCPLSGDLRPRRRPGAPPSAALGSRPRRCLREIATSSTTRPVPTGASYQVKRGVTSGRVPGRDREGGAPSGRVTELVFLVEAIGLAVVDPRSTVPLVRRRSLCRRRGSELRPALGSSRTATAADPEVRSRRGLPRRAPSTRHTAPGSSTLP